MKYFAAVVTDEEVSACVALPPYRILCSYWTFRKQMKLIQSYVEKGYELFLDSGAFSAANSEANINLDDYCQYVLESGASIYAGLDVIGDPTATMCNVRYMEEKYGLNPIPTFHMGGRPDELRNLFSYHYIALGGMVFSSGRERYCDEIWSILLKEAPGIRVHGFGMTNIELMERYPWYSVDSSTYKDGRRFGRPKLLQQNMEMIQIDESEFGEIMKKMGYENIDGMKENEKKKWRFLMDLHGVQAYKVYGAHLAALNKTKKFDYLTAQHKLF
jgi:hypothetical protein